MNEDILLHEALEAFKRETGFLLEIQSSEGTLPGRPWGDALVKLGSMGLHFHAEVKRRAAQINSGALLSQLRHLPKSEKGLLVTDYINPRLADRLRAEGIQFIDTAGNAFIDSPPVYVYIKGNRKSEIAMPEKQITGRAFKPTGLRVVFALLNDPSLINEPYREIAIRAQVALGNIGWILRELVNLGYVEEGLRAGEKQLTQQDKLVQKWIEAYPIILRPKLILGKFTTANPDWHTRINPIEYGGCWGGELAAWLSDKYLTPGKYMIYLDKHKLNAFLQTARLKRAEPGNRDEREILVLEKFWDTAIDNKKPDLAPPLLIYADLVATGDSRNLEAAERIRARHFA
jgi:hypothetical protein